MSKQLGWVYLIHATDTDLYKIGCTSRHPKQRISELQSDTGCPVELECHKAVLVRYYEELEQQLHGRYKDFKTRAEWYRLSDEKLDDVTTEMVQELRTDGALRATELLQNLSSEYTDAERELGHKIGLAFNRAIHSEDGKAKALLWHLLEWFDSEHEDLFEGNHGEEVEKEMLSVLK